MGAVTKTQIGVIAGSIVLIVLLLFTNTTIPKKEEAKMSEHSTPNSAGILTLIENAKAKLSASQKKEVEMMEEAVKSSPDKKTAFENIINQWDTLRQPAVAAYYFGQAAMASPNEQNWYEAGNRFFGAARLAAEGDKGLIYGKAIECYEKTLELNPKNMEAKINLGACYVEGSPEPMKGIGLLREAEKTDSNNVNLQLNFAFFSEKSGQWDRAIRRFEKVLVLKPDFIDAYLHLSDAYQQKGDKAKAIESLEKYYSLVDDESVKKETRDYINKLKTN